MSHQKPEGSAEDSATEAEQNKRRQQERREAPLTWEDEERGYIESEHYLNFRRPQE